jgi:hypothetical protein
MNRDSNQPTHIEMASALRAFRDTISELAPSDWPLVEARLQTVEKPARNERSPFLIAVAAAIVVVAFVLTSSYPLRPPRVTMGAHQPQTAMVRAKPESSAGSIVAKKSPSEANLLGSIRFFAKGGNAAPANRARFVTHRKPLGRKSPERRTDSISSEEALPHKQRDLRMARRESVAGAPVTDGSAGTETYQPDKMQYVMGVIPAAYEGRTSTTAALSEEQRIW